MRGRKEGQSSPVTDSRPDTLCSTRLRSSTETLLPHTGGEVTRGKRSHIKKGFIKIELRKIHEFGVEMMLVFL